jgi:hypothetical protein
MQLIGDVTDTARHKETHNFDVGNTYQGFGLAAIL